MSACATVTFDCERPERFDQVYEAVCDTARDVALDIGAYVRGTKGVIEFMVDDYGAFEKAVAMASARIALRLESLDYLLSERSPIKSPDTTRGQ